MVTVPLSTVCLNSNALLIVTMAIADTFAIVLPVAMVTTVMIQKVHYTVYNGIKILTNWIELAQIF